MSSILGEKLKLYREASGLTQMQVADALNIDRSTYAYYESGKTSPDINSVTRLIRIFGVSYYDLTDDNEDALRVSDGSDESASKADSENDNAMYVNKLSKQEKELIINFRTLSKNQRDDLMYSLSLSAYGNVEESDN